MGQTKATYPKTYARVKGLFPIPGPGTSPPWPEWLVVETEDGRQLTLSMRQKCGGKSSTQLRIGVRIKLYRRPQDRGLVFRQVGS